jgi:hypothetical protein
VVVTIILLAAILSASLKTNALLGRWETPGGWIEFSNNGTVVIGQNNNVQVQSYQILDDHRIEIHDSNNKVDVLYYTIINNSLVINNITYNKAGDTTPGPQQEKTTVAPPAALVITPTIVVQSANPADLAATLSPQQTGWFVVVNGKPVQMDAQDIHFDETEVTSFDRFPKVQTKIPVVLARDDGFAHLLQLEIRSSTGGPGIVLGESNKLVVVRTANNAAANAGLRPGDIVLTVNGMDVNGNLSLASSQLLGDFGTSVTMKVMQGTAIKEMTFYRTVQVSLGTTDVTIEPITESSTGYMRLTPKTPLVRGLHCYYYNARPSNESLRSYNEFFCFVVE